MKTFNRIILFILVCCFGYAAFRQTLGAEVDDHFFLLKYLCLVILVILTVCATVTDIQGYRSDRRLYQFYTSLIGLFLCGIVIFRLVNLRNIRNSTTLFSAIQKSGNVISREIEFKQKGYFVFKEYTSPVSRTYYGQYQKNKDTLTIISTNHERYADSLPVTAVIQHELLIWGNRDTMQIIHPLLSL